MVNGTVTLSLAEVDLLRNTIEEEKSKVESLSKELIEVKADRKIMKITKTINEGSYVHIKEGSTAEKYISAYVRADIQHNRGSRYVGGEDAYINKTARAYLEDAIIRNPYWSNGLKYNDKDNEKIEYINLDDVKQSIRKSIEDEYVHEITNLRVDKSNFNNKIADLKNDHQKDIKKLEDMMDEILKKYAEEVKDWTERYDDLANDKKELSQIEVLTIEIEDLKSKLSVETNKKWYQKLFN